jgi:hypothetical protein
VGVVDGGGGVGASAAEPLVESFGLGKHVAPPTCPGCASCRDVPEVKQGGEVLKAQQDGIAYGVIGIGEGLAAAVVGVRQAVELVVGVGDDAGGGGVSLADDADGGRLRVSPAQPVDGQRHGVGARLGVRVGVRQRRGGARRPVAIVPVQTIHRTAGLVTEGDGHRGGPYQAHRRSRALTGPEKGDILNFRKHCAETIRNYQEIGGFDERR